MVKNMLASTGRKDLIAYPGYWTIIGMFVYRTYKIGTTVKDASRYPQD